MQHPDDAAVVRLPNGDQIVQTVDIIAPIVDDPAMFGRIACANSVSDVYAMGGVPISALNIACFPAKSLPLSVLRTIMEGAIAALHEIDCALVGGHVVDDEELKFGFAVTGLVSGPILSIDRARVNDVLVLTKPLGTGVVNQALRKDAITSRSDVYLEAERSMAALNAAPAEAARKVEASSATDITGFGLLGHSAQFARASGVTFEIDPGAVPAFDGVQALLRDGVCAGRAKVNAEAYRERIGGLKEEHVGLLFDPQTSGGLMVLMEETRVDEFVRALGDWKLGAAVIGRVVQRRDRDVVLR
jgi:selenide, water dikinase